MPLTRITRGVIKPNDNYDTHDINSTGIITATKFVGDGSDLTSLPAGLGTALSQTQSSPLSQLYYVNDTLHITIETVVQLPDSSSNAYTNYSNIEVGDNINLTIGDDVNLVPDVLELGIH